MSAPDPTATLRLWLPVELTVRLSAPPAVPGAAKAPPEAPEARRSARDYDDREGYDEDFLGVPVPLPTLTRKGLRRVSRRTDGEPAEGDHVLRYHHYTVVMNRVRRFCFFTAANTTRDPRLAGTIDRKELGASWRFDPRIAREHQVGHEEFYLPAIHDKGHIHRREDGYWGSSEAEREAGNDDSFHFTNAAPQHPRFNQSTQDGVWGLLENHIAEQVASQRFALFAGPVFRSDDPEVEGILVPQSFWKIVIARKGSDLGAWAFHLSQEDLPSEAGRERFDPGEFVHHQVSVAAVERMTDVRFDAAVRDADALRLSPDERIALRDATSVRRLR
ncbi:MAG: DNA/RNA non-specific endonuclease [Deltaproteobacteria bacterium]|nr:DNA/RNA non-specific endonuclease [Deltaproteobacteria bacterium]